MEFEIRYTVLKNTDIDKYLSKKQQEQLHDICDAIDLSRERGDREPLGCVVIEQDWPEFGPTLRLLGRRVDRETLNEAGRKNAARLAEIGR